MKAQTMTLEERVNYACQQLALIHAACLAVTNLDFLQFEDDDVLYAVAELARDVADLLGPVAHAPVEIANWEPPDPEPDATDPDVPGTPPAVWSASPPGATVAGPGA